MSKLGRGLDSLLNQQQKVNKSQTNPSHRDDKGMMQFLATEALQRGAFQPREDIDPDSLADLVDSISRQGILQPIIVRTLNKNNQSDPIQYEIIAGERRFQAAKLAKLTQVPVIIRHLSDKEALAIALIENIQREALTPLEEAVALQRLVIDFAMTHQEVASVVSRSRSAVSNLIRLLQLDERVQRLLSHNDIEMGHARALLPLDDDQQFLVANYIIDKQLSVRQTEFYIRKLHKRDSTKSPVEIVQSYPKALDENILSLSLSLRAKISIKPSKNTPYGKLVIDYDSIEQLNNLLEKMQALQPHKNNH